MTDCLNVLAVDDDDITAELVTRALGKFDRSYNVVAASDGAAGLAVLRGEGAAGMPAPCLVLLDLNMPRMDGFELLAAIRSDPLLAQTVVFVLTTSDDESDIVRAYRLQIAGYMTKSTIGPRYERLASVIDDYASAVKFPHAEP
jgi:CheY-like chemotaxis protein